MRPLRALLLAVLATPAAAQVTPEDVWAVNEVWWEGWGLTLDATLARDEGALRAREVLARADLPLGLGTLSVELPDLLLTERGDGTVAAEVPEPATFRIDLRLFLGEEVVALALPGRMDWTGREATAREAPAGVTFASRADRLVVTLDGAAMDQGPGTPVTSLEFDASWEGIVSETTIRREEGWFAVDGVADWDASLYSYAVRETGGGASQGVGRGGATSLGVTWGLPLGGLQASGLPQALRDGARLEWSSVAADTLAQTISEGSMGGPVTQTQEAEESSLRLALGEGGLEVAGSAAGSTFRVEADDLPMPITGSLAEAGANLLLPLLASPARQPFAYGLTLRDLSVGDAVWDLADPGRALPRDPLSLDLAMGGAVVLPFDLPDLEGLATLGTAEDLPFDLASLAVERFLVEGAGVTAEGRGAFTFDPADRETFPGLPRPEGQASLTLGGVQALLDALVAGGLATTQQARDARLGLAFAFRADGPDRSTAVVEVAPGGEVLLNGVKVR